MAPKDHYTPKLTRRRAVAYESLSKVLADYKRGQIDEQICKDELWHYRHELVPALGLVVRRTHSERNTRRLRQGKRPVPNKFNAASPIPELRIKVRRGVVPYRTYYNPKTKRHLMVGIPHSFTYLHSICLYLYAKRNFRTYEALEAKLAEEAVTMIDGRSWTAARLKDALKGSEVGVLLDQG